MFLRPLMLLAVVYCLGGYVYYLGTGRLPIPESASQLSFSSSNEGKGDTRPDLKRLTEMPQLNSIKADSANDETIYQWQDENGVWNISNQPPE